MRLVSCTWHVSVWHVQPWVSDGPPTVIRQQLYCRYLTGPSTSHSPDAVHGHQHRQHSDQCTDGVRRQARLDYCNYWTTFDPTYHRCQGMYVHCMFVPFLTCNESSHYLFYWRNSFSELTAVFVMYIFSLLSSLGSINLFICNCYHCFMFNPSVCYLLFIFYCSLIAKMLLLFLNYYALCLPFMAQNVQETTHWLFCHLILC